MKKLLPASLSLLVLFTIGSQSSAKNQDEKDLVTKDQAKGKQLMKDSGCLTCHYVDGEGGFIAPPLSGISKYSDKAAILKLLSDKTKKKKITSKYPSPQALMSHVALNKRDAELIATYLISLPEDKSISIKGHKNLDSEDKKKSQEYFPLGSQFKPKKTSSRSRKGKRLFNKKGCIACHATKGSGGRLGPALDGIGSHRSLEFIKNRIKQGAIIMKCGSTYEPSKYSMPPSQLSSKQVKLISEYLLTLPVRPTEN